MLAYDSNYATAHALIGFAYRGQGRYQEAIEEYQKYVRLAGNDPDALKEPGVTYSLAGQPSKAFAIIRRLRASRIGSPPPFALAALFASVGNRAQAYQWLEEAIIQHAPSCWQLSIDPAFTALRSEVRFQQLLRLVMQP